MVDRQSVTETLAERIKRVTQKDVSIVGCDPTKDLRKVAPDEPD